MSEFVFMRQSIHEWEKSNFIQNHLQPDQTQQQLRNKIKLEAKLGTKTAEFA